MLESELGGKVQAEYINVESLAHIRYLKSFEWEASHGQSVDKVDKYFKKK